MNIKKQLKKIKDAFEVLEISKEQLENELLQYQRAAHKFVKFELPDHMAREEFKELLGDTTPINWNSSDVATYKFVDNLWVRIVPDGEENACQSTYDEIAKENARLREALKWHPMSELPDRVAHIHYLSKNVILDSPGLSYRIAYYSYALGQWWEFNNSDPIDVNKNSRWCYIPDEKDGK